MADLVPFTVLSAVASLSSELEGWTLLENANERLRKYRCVVEFEQKFVTAPVVHVGIAALDTSNDANLRVRVRAIDVTTQGFVIEAETWFNSKVWAVDVSWLAIGT